ncbi:YicC/YloC family endoribonuclease [Fodinibius sp.]|uniref:YicC/YloC family endoribonuclease n=1 Tax=Fodinibius sp. TaxID=1872440 RepID=UPI002ACEE661|nr:YicC/YloC family endoribonuclease [Fodinibius sp.]MDZ7657877.1 YicC/YloC family endoribonuclease [Fodinibius sp.]
MITSMTGFGRGEASENGITVTVELKSVNSRYLDISLRLPQSLQDKELDIKEILQDHVERGKVNVSVRVDKSETGEPEITFNKKLVEGYKQLLNELRDAANIEAPITLQTLLEFNDIFEQREDDEETRKQIWELAQKAVEDAALELKDMRLQEGSQLENDLNQRIDHIEEMLNIVMDKVDGRSEEIKEDLVERINELIDSDKIDPDRLEMEVAVLVDKMDITEEIVRTQSHIKFFREAVNNDNSVGRRLNFLSQEINREINTIGSKANDSEISQYIVKAKESLEQIREQVQNVE